ncbi:MAG: hypothetical protein Q7S17_05135 [Xanthobacteraceae bacterium]|nr:hypothetical protein [Xanthobacteraceae bacterium]
MTDQIFATPAAAQGTNVPDYAAEESARLAREFSGLEKDVTDLLAEARALPTTVEDEPTANLYTKTITRFGDLDTRLDKFRESEKLPYLRRGTAVDSFFGRMRERLFRKKKTDKAGGADILHDRLHAYNVKREADERRKREEAERVAREAEEQARLAREKAQREQREAEEKAARARKTANIEEQQRLAREAEERAAAARAAEDEARDIRRDAEAAAAAKPADLVRERHEGGAMNTMKQVPYVEMTDSMALDVVALWPFVKNDAKEAALKAWAKVVQYKKPMAGAIIEYRNETVVRR